MNSALRRTLRWTLILAALIAVVGIALRLSLPTALSAGLVGWLEARGASDVKVERVAVRVLDGRLELSGLAFRAGGRTTRLERAVIEIDWATTDTGRLHVSSAHIEGLRTHARIGDGAPRLAGLEGTGDAAAGAAFLWALDHARLRDAELLLFTPNGEHRIALREANVSAAMHERGTGAFDAEARWNGRPLRLSGSWSSDGARHAAHARLETDGVDLAAAATDLGIGVPLSGIGRMRARIHWTRDGSEEDLAAVASLQVDGLRLDAGAVRLSAPGAALTGQLRRASGTSTLAGELEAAPLLVETADGTALAADRLGWRGTLAHAAGLWQIDGRWDAESFAARRTGDGGLALDAESASLEGPLRFGTEPFTHAGSLAASKLNARPGTGSWRAAALRWQGRASWSGGLGLEGAIDAEGVDANGLAGIQRLRGESFALDAGAISAARVVAEGIAQPPSAGPTRARAERATLESVRHAGGDLAIGRIALAGFGGTLARTPGGAWRAAGATAGEAEPAAVAPLRVRIGRIEIDGKGSLEIDDRAVTPPHRRALTLDRLRIDGIDSGDATAPARVDLAATVDRHATVAANGTWQPFAPQADLDLKLTVRQLELPPLAGYLLPVLGRSIVSGQLDADTRLRIADGDLVAENRLTLRRLELGAAPEGSTPPPWSGGLSLDAALAMLRDSKGDVRLDLPVRGALDDPKFDLDDALATATGKALQVTALTYIKQSIQPFGTLVTLAELGARGIAAVRLDPLRFGPGSALLDASGRQYLERIAALLGERPQLRLRLCGKAVPADLPDDAATRAIDAPGRADLLIQLAQARAEAVKDDLVDAHGVAPERLFLCQPEALAGEAESGRVELLI